MKRSCVAPEELNTLFEMYGIRLKEVLKNGKYDSLAISGKDLELSIDIQLQKYAEKLMENKKGSIVAIEPSSGRNFNFSK